MDDYISRQDAIEAAKHAWAKGLEPTQYIEQIPAADVRPVVRGRWLHETEIEGHSCGECSACHKIRVIDNFCPNCGAIMMEE